MSLDMSHVSTGDLVRSLAEIARDEGHLPVTKAVLVEAGKRLAPVAWRYARAAQVLKQHAKDIRAGLSGGDGTELDWHAADVLDYVADNFPQIAARQP